MIAMAIVAVLTWSILDTVNRTKRAYRTSRNAYAAQLVAYMCVEHMKTNSQAWPTAWDELHDDFDTGVAQSAQKWEWTLADLKKRVEVDWRADLEQFQSNPNAAPLIWIAECPDHVCRMQSPNEIIARYLEASNLNTE